MLKAIIGHSHAVGVGLNFVDKVGKSYFIFIFVYDFLF
jgi:hypothetical protein